MLTASQKLDLASTAADDSQRICKVLENKALQDETRMESLENQLKEARVMAEEADKKYDEISKVCEKNPCISREIAICSIHFPFLGVRQTVRTVNDLFSPSHEG